MGSNPIHSKIRNIAQLVARLFWEQKVMCSNHIISRKLIKGAITQMARVFVLHTKGYQFKSGLLHRMYSSMVEQ